MYAFQKIFKLTGTMGLNTQNMSKIIPQKIWGKSTKNKQQKGPILTPKKISNNCPKVAKCTSSTSNRTKKGQEVPVSKKGCITNKK